VEEEPADGPSAGSAAEGPAADGSGTGEIEQSSREVTLMFPSPEDEVLHGQARRILWTASVEDRARQTLTELAAGPQEGLLPALPADARLREFFLLSDGTGVADFSGEIRGVKGGTDGERTALQAIAHTLTFNFPEIRRVMILVDGDETETLAGHIDLRYPVVPDPALLGPGPVNPSEEQPGPKAVAE
jgi:spore germination protein GerM